MKLLSLSLTPFGILRSHTLTYTDFPICEKLIEPLTTFALLIVALDQRSKESYLAIQQNAPSQSVSLSLVT